MDGSATIVLAWFLVERRLPVVFCNGLLEFLDLSCFSFDSNAPVVKFQSGDLSIFLLKETWGEFGADELGVTRRGREYRKVGKWKKGVKRSILGSSIEEAWI